MFRKQRSFLQITHHLCKKHVQWDQELGSNDKNDINIQDTATMDSALICPARLINSNSEGDFRTLNIWIKGLMGEIFSFQVSKDTSEKILVARLKNDPETETISLVSYA
jgi:hypothetical protein